MMIEKCNQILDETGLTDNGNDALAREAAVKYCQTLETYFKYPGPDLKEKILTYFEGYRDALMDHGPDKK